MKPGEINIAIAEFYGYKKEDIKWVGSDWKAGERFVFRDDAGDILSTYLPNFHGDLTSIHKAILKLNPDQQYTFGEHCRVLAKCEGPRGGHFTPNGFGVFAIVTLTAPQLCEALLKTIGKWKETVI